MLDHPSSRLPADKRQKLFLISGGEFAAKGFSQASLNRIISQMGMSKSSFYHYFSNKSDLFRQTFLFAVAPILELDHALDIRAPEAADIWPAIEGLAMQLLPIVQASPLPMLAGRMFYRARDDQGGGKVLAEELLASFTTWISRQLRHGQKLGAFRTDLPESLLIALIVALGMSMDQWMLEHWDELEDAEKMRLSAAGFDLLKRLLSPA